MTEPLFTDSDWTFPLIERVYEEIEKIGVGELGLNIYANDIEIINSEQMLDAYSSVGLPVFYKHWSFGKEFARNKGLYDAGMQGLAYEIVINADPVINYLMEENTMTMQTLVIAHAAMGHNHFFKNNHMFRQWTDASSIIDYLVFARDFITKTEEREGRIEVERFLDACHALMSYGVNRFKRPNKLSTTNEKLRQDEREDYSRRAVNELFDRLLKKQESSTEADELFPKEPEENLLYFAEKYADIPTWKREILRIVRKISQYFYPQTHTKVMNEGCATYVHHRILNRMHSLGMLSDGSWYEFTRSHTNVTFQPTYDDPRYSGWNPYAVGFAMMTDIARICNKPTDEDRRWFPDIAGCGDDMGVLKDAWANFRDESFIRQYMSPKVIRDFKLFRVKDNKKETNLQVTAIHDDSGYEKIRESFADQYEQHSYIPQLEVVKVEPKTRIMHVVYKPYRNRVLKNIPVMLNHIATIWGNPVVLTDDKGNTLT
jgi:stage V sporulation protein R